LLKLEGEYQNKMMTRLELAINLDTLEIPFMQECENLYHEFVAKKMADSLQGYFEQLRTFMKRKKEKYGKA
jgi:hypothetical protein